MVTKLNKLELIEKLKDAKGELVVSGEQVGFSPKGSPVFYWFRESYNGTMNGDYIWSQSNGKKSYSFTRFFNFAKKYKIK